MKRLLTILLTLLFLLPISGCSSKTSNGEAITSLDDINGLTLGCMSGSIYDQLIKDNFADSDIIYYNGRSELLLALKSGKIAAYVADEPVGMLMCNEAKEVTYLDQNIGTVDFGIIFSKSKEELRNQFNEYLNTIRENGHLRELQEKWICPTGAEQKRADIKLSGENGTLICSTTPDAAPFSFYKNNDFQGYDVELMYEFCERYGYDLKIDLLSFDALISSVTSEKYDIAFNGIYATEERKQMVLYSDTTYVGRNVIMVLKNEAVKEDTNIINSFINGIHTNLIEEDRWKLLVSGTLTTIFISLAAVIIGAIVGLIMYCFTMIHPIFTKINDWLTIAFARIPIVIILMIFFYVIFNSSTISGIFVSVVCYGFYFAVTNYSLIKSGVEAVEPTQFDSALSLGYDRWTAFYKFILPQALRLMATSYESTITTIIKNTSVVGYVSVSDLTRTSDIIRGRTFDAMFLLTVVAIIYFIICSLIIKLVHYLFSRKYKRI